MEQATARSEKPVIKVLGIGGAGKNVLEELMKQGSSLDLIAINTDKESLDRSTAGTKILIGIKACQGKGASRKFVLGEKAARESAEEIKEVLKGADMAVMVAGMGGGTGSGSTPVILDIARSLRMPAMCVIFTPLEFEGVLCQKQAEISIEKLGNSADAVISLSLQQIAGNCNKKMTMDAMFNLANQMAAGWIKIIAMNCREMYKETI